MSVSEKFQFLFGALVLFFGLTAMGAAPPKEALLIANGKYSHFAGLAHPETDAEKLGAALEGLGFRVRVVRDGNREEMLEAISEFERELRNTGAIAFFHYGGHGVQVDGKNYLLPADADIPDERRVATRAVALDEVMTAMDAAAARASIIVIDACRDNPLPAGSGRNLARGLSVVGMKPKNSIVIYAAEAGSKALDGLFTPILASALQQKGRTIDQIMKSVRSEVYTKSNGQQTPGEYNQLFEELFLGEQSQNSAASQSILPGTLLTESQLLNDQSNPKEGWGDIDQLKKIADQGDAEAQYKLARRYLLGEGAEKNPAEAVKWSRKAAEQEHPKAPNILGICYRDGFGVSKDLKEAVKLFKKSANSGFDKAQFNLGGCYRKGEGVQKDEGEAVKWYRKAAEQGLAFAQCYLGYCYANGQGIQKDQALSVKWYLKSAEQGLAEAQFCLGNCYSYGEGVPQDPAEAVTWYLKAAEQGLAMAQFTLGKKYAKGNGVEKDEVEATKWFRKAAEQGLALAQFSLGRRLMNGEGVSKDQVEAVKWFLKSAEHGDAAAQASLGYCYKRGEGVPKDFNEAVKWFRKAVKKLEPTALMSLGLCYKNGQGVAKDSVEAYAYLNLAGASLESARDNIATLEKKMSKEQISAGQRRSKEIKEEISKTNSL